MIVITTATAFDAASTAPVWVNGSGVKFNVASWPDEQAPKGAWTPESDTPAPQAPAVIAGMDGLSALAAMGLVPVGDA
jgi:hypothetical protein